MIQIDTNTAVRSPEGDICWVLSMDKTIAFERFPRRDQAGLFCWAAFSRLTARRITARLETLAAAQVAAAEEISEPTPTTKPQSIMLRRCLEQGYYHG